MEHTEPEQQPDDEPVTEEGGLLDTILERLQSGEPLDLDALGLEFPSMADEIPRLVELVGFVHGASGQVQPLGDLDAALAIGQCPTVDGYQIQRLIARGGMGAVYLAREQGLDRTVAIKFLASGAACSQQELARFRREAHNASRLSHRGIVPIYRIGELESVPYYSMQFIDGPSLADVFRERRDRNTDFIRRVATWGQHIADALSHAHSECVIHRDVKPSNILIDMDGRAYITDFGLARKASDATLTQTGSLIGTLRYMSPEQARGGGELDERSDVYSLGATLYELLSGKRVIEGDEREELLRKVLLEVPAPLRSLNPNVPADLAVVIHKALAKRREDRYQSAALMRADLDRMLTGHDIEAHAPSLKDNLRSLDRDHRLAFRGAILAFFLVSILSLITGTQAFRISSDRQRISEESGRASRAKEFLIGVLFYGNPKRNDYSEDFGVLLDRVASNLAEEFTDDPATEAEIHFRLGDVFSTRSQFEKADEQLKLAIDLGAHSPQISSATLAIWTITRADLLVSLGRAREAMATLQDLELGLLKTALQGDVHSALASAHVALGNVELALAHIQQSTAILESLDDLSPLVHAANLGEFGGQLQDIGLPLDAVTSYRSQVAILTAELPADAHALLVAQCYLAGGLSEIRTPATDLEAEAHYRGAVMAMRVAVPPHVTDTAWAERGWARALYVLGETEQAEKLLTGSLKTLRERLGDADLVIQALESYGVFLFNEQRLPEAQTLATEALAMCARLGFQQDARTKRLELLLQSTL